MEDLPAEWVARYCVVPYHYDQKERRKIIDDFLRNERVAFPVVFKPDVGERGKGVGIIRSEKEIEHYLTGIESDIIVQEYVSGREFGVFYYRYPDEEHGSIYSITKKTSPVVVGDGINTLERLILGDSRAVCKARTFFARNKDRLQDIPQPGEEIELTELGTHSRGSVFSNGINMKTGKLEHIVDTISRQFEGFFFGRYDVRARSSDAFKNGEFKIIELNGATSEATHIYDPGINIIGAYKTLFEQWRICFEIGSRNIALGHKPSSFRELGRYARTKTTM